MKLFLRIHQQVTFTATLITVVFCLSIGAVSTGQAEQVSAWQITKIAEFKNDKKYSRGLLLYTTGADKMSVAFRCESGKLFAFLAVKPADFKQILQQRSQSPRDREVRFSIDNGAEATENWVQMFSGRIYMVRKISTTLDVFRAATTGATITFTRKYGKTVIIPLPEVDQETFGSFLTNCDLNVQYRPLP